MPPENGEEREPLDRSFGGELMELMIERGFVEEDISEQDWHDYYE